ncbi:regulatory protein YycI of two-component signal transduction system YycFG [Natronobacillus azotifigens]|uniref:Two-component system regulatory protein YycI n=1 Tax=Natronobacillus azotifigens TaxID=472978 RepID=A0A9J6RA63_9BACI|nr:two-component system regulatory protein YycI [Natronobacillus azotifigens]MCZ0702246.1 two-component system regulatory protein YycI [Natronobacillus azotifigens]
MQWAQIKTLFIICFLILNIFLVRQLIDRQEENLSFIPEATREDELALNLSGLDNLSDQTYSAPLIYAKNYQYNEETLEEVDALDNQRAAVINSTHLFSRFDHPIDVSMDDPQRLREIIDNNILYGESYMFWERDEQANVLIFFQRIEEPVFYNQHAVLLIQLNRDGEMVQYVQTRLQQEEDSEEEQDLILQYDAVSRLYYNSNELNTGDTIDSIRLGYHNLISLPNGEQVLNPAWNIQVNEDRNYFINAIEGHGYPRNRDFLQTTVASFTDVIDNASENNFQFIHTEDAEEEARLLNTIKQSLISVYHTIIEVESE